MFVACEKKSFNVKCLIFSCLLFSNQIGQDKPVNKGRPKHFSYCFCLLSGLDEKYVEAGLGRSLVSWRTWTYPLQVSFISFSCHRWAKVVYFFLPMWRRKDCLCATWSGRSDSTMAELLPSASTISLSRYSLMPVIGSALRSTALSHERFVRRRIIST